MQGLRPIQITFSALQDLLVKSFLSNGQGSITDSMWFPRNVLWQFETELMNHPNPYCDWAGGTRKLCTTYPTDLLTFIFYKSGLLQYNLILWFYCIYLHLSMESVFIVGHFHPAVCPSPQQPSVGTGGISHRLSPAWNWSQRLLSKVVRDCWVYAWLFHHLMGWNMSLAAPSRARGLFDLFPRYHVPHSAAGFSQPSCGCRFFLLTAGPPDLRHALAPTHHEHACVYIML